MKNIKLLAFWAVFLLSAFVSSAWAADITVTYDIGYTGKNLDRTGFITRADNSSLTFTWARGAGVVWRADYAYGVDDEYDITFTPNKELNSHDKIFTTEHNTTFTVTTAAENNYRIKSVVFMDANNVTTGSSTGNNKKTVTVTVPSSKDIVHVTVTLIPLSGSCGDNATWTMTDDDGNDTYETLTITGTGAITSSPWATDFAATISRVNIGNAELSISGNPFSTLGSEVAIVVPTPAYAVTYSNAAYAAKLRVALGSYLFKATGTADDAAYEIATETDLRNLSAAIDATENISSGKKFRQTTDIAMTGGNFTPIGNGNEFQGTYDGQGYTISGLSISKDFGSIGFFGIIQNAAVKNIVLVNPTVRATSSNDRYSSELGSLIGHAFGSNTIENCYVINPTFSIGNSNEDNSLGAVIGKIFSDYMTVINCYYYDNVHNYATIGTNDGGHLTNVGRTRKVTFGDGVVVPASVSADQGFSYDIDGDKISELFYREGVKVTVSVADANGIIDEISGVKASDVTLAEDKRSATFTMPGENVDISATTSEVHTVSVPEGLAISDDAYVTIGDVNYYKTGESYTLTTTKANYVIDGITGVTATVLKDKRSATFTMPSENVEISATISKIWGDGDGSKEHPYTISSALDLDSLASRVNAGNDFENTYFEVDADIVYTYEGVEQEDNYTAIGKEDKPFKGQFNGNGHTISGIRIYKPNAEYQGLFGFLGEGAVVENVKLADVEITGNGGSGGIAGYNDKGEIRNCTVENDVIINARYLIGGIVGDNGGGTISGCTSSATLIAPNGSYIGGIVGHDGNGTISNNLAKNVTISASYRYGAVVGKNDNSKLSNNFYIACTVNGVENAHNVGVGDYKSPSDVTEDNGAVGLFKVTLGEGISIVAPEKPTYTDNGQNYYKSGETLTLEVVFAGSKKPATFTVPSKDVEISVTPSEIHTVSVPEGLVLGNPYITIDGVKYGKPGETYTLTATKVNYFIDEITGVTVATANDKKSATFTMPDENVEISAKISKVWGDGDGTKEHPFTIASVSELDMLALAVNSGNDFENTYFEVIEDIAYDNTIIDENGDRNNYTAIGNYDNRFKGKFNGNGKTISGIRIYKPDAECQGLFGALGEGAEVENVKLADVEITAHYYAGGIAGLSYYGTIRNCTVEKTVKLMSSGENVSHFGGIAGYNSGTVSGCTSSATLIASGENVSRFGGIVGASGDGSVSNNLAKNVTISVPATTTYNGTVVGFLDTFFSYEFSNNFYTACTVNGVENAANVGVGGEESPRDVTENNGAVGISFTEPAAVKNLVYNKSSHNLVTAGKTDFGTMLYSLDGKTYAADIPAATNAGDYSVYYRVDKDDENVILPQKIEVSIAKATLTVTAKDKAIVYGDDPANDGVEYSGFIGDETASVLGGKLTYSYDYKKLDKVGKYTITPGGLTASNYKITFVAGALNVEPKATHYAAVQVLEDENGKRAEIDGEYGEGDGISITEPLEVASVEFSREFSTQGYSTIVLPFDVNTSKLSGVDSVLSFARIVKEQGEMAVGMKVVWEASAAHVKLKANTPYMVKMTGAKLGIDGGVTLLPTKAAVTKSDVQNDGWEFRGTYAYKSWREGDEDLCRVYGFAGGSNDEVSEGDFVKFTAGASLRPLRAYLINTNRTCVAPQKARANGDYVLRAARYSIDDLPESMRVVIVGDGNERTTVIGHFNTRTGEFTSTRVRKFDLKGRAVRGTPSARGAYYGKRVKK